MHKGTMGGAEWISCGLRKDGSRAILWRGEILWIPKEEFQALLDTEV